MTATLAAKPAAPAAPPGSPSRVRTPTVLQMQVTECGAAALAMILAFYGRWVSLEELRERCGASRDGTTAADLVRAAEHYGLTGTGFYRRRALLPDLGYPLLLVWRSNHFVVLEGIDERVAYLNDPAWGPRQVPLDEFDRDYSKICLALRPTPEFVPGGRRPSAIAPLVRRGRPVIGEVLAVVVVGLLATIPGLALAAISKFFVDDVLVRGLYDRAWGLVTALALVAVLQFVLQRFQQWILTTVGTRLVVAESARFVHHALRLPERYFVVRSVADLGQRVQDNRAVIGLLTGTLASVGVSMIVIVVYGVAMFVVDPVLAAVAITLTLANLVAMRAALNRQRNLSRLLVQEESALVQTTAYGAMTIETLKAGGLEGDFYARWEGTAVRIAEVRQRIAVLTQLTGSVPVVLRSLVTALILGIGALRVIDGDLGIGSLIAFQSLAISFGNPFSELAKFTHQLQHVQNLVHRLDDVLEEPVDSACDPAVQSFEYSGGPVRLDGAISLDGISFGFKATAAPLIKEFDLRVAPGQRVAVVGRSGSGKSTVVRIAAGLYEPWSGRVLFDGQPRHEIPRPVLANSVAMVDQRIALFAGSVRDNLTLWDDAISDDDVVRAARDAQIHDDIVARAGGYSSWVADGGANWSGGQRQRFEIARALVRNPSVLLLDEATSALDAETEAAIEDAVRRRGCTALIVAHRLSTVRDADLILVMDKGLVVERGRHGELLAAGGHYAQLVRE
jgi:NHLM bacteriocin system ABC transporter peptidase/ATP-binding protein